MNEHEQLSRSFNCVHERSVTCSWTSVHVHLFMLFIKYFFSIYLFYLNLLYSLILIYLITQTNKIGKPTSTFLSYYSHRKIQLNFVDFICVREPFMNTFISLTNEHEQKISFGKCSWTVREHIIFLTNEHEQGLIRVLLQS